MDTILTSEVVPPLARFIGIFAPSLYCGFTASDSLTFVEPIITHAPNQKVMAKQWYHGYQYGPSWVPPLIAPGTLANLYLAYTTSTSMKRDLYLIAAAGIFSILPITFFFMEPNINGACKWKVQSLLRDEGFSMPETTILMPSSRKHGGSRAARAWADRADMKDLIRFWRKVNNFRWVIGGVAAMLSGFASLAM